MSKVAVLLSGCGVYDGSEIYETTLSLLALDGHGAQVQCFAPEGDQLHVVDHSTGEEVEGESRSIYKEAARLARGEIRPLAELVAEDFDVLLLPGGFGAAKNLCDFAVEGKECRVRSDVAQVIEAFYEAGKPLGFLCISPVIAAKVLGAKGISLTIGNDAETAEAIESFGARHVKCEVTEVIVDREHKIVSSPAYMLGRNLTEVSEGIHRFVEKLLSF